MKKAFYARFDLGTAIILILIALSLQSTMAAVPAGYYDQANQANATTLKNSLHEIIDDHQRFPYTSTSTDTWDILEIADQDQNNASNVIDVYKNASYVKVGGGNTNYNREHSWPKSYGFPNDGSDNYAYTDTHHLFISDSGYNSSRSNKPYANCDTACTEKITLLNNGRGGISSQSNWTAGSFSNGSWETWSGRRGDVARALMYMAVRYEGGVHGVTGVSEPDLILTDDRNLISNSNQGTNISVAYMGLKSVLLQWHNEDPVDDIERQRNDAIYGFQGNRNPFVDHPEYVTCVFENICSGGTGDTTPPSAPIGLSATGGNGQVSLTWAANTETDLAGYNVYRSDISGGGYTKLNASLVSTTSYTDSNLAAASSYYYVVTAVDSSINESILSSEVMATVESGGGATVPGTAWINELHYDNSGADSGEFIEVAGTAGTDLNGWSLVAYNGNGGAPYKTVNLLGIIVDQQNGFGTLSFSIPGLQNGGPDGIALVDSTGSVVQFLSYEGSLTATSGVASGMISTDIVVTETGSTLVGHSLQLSGNGSSYAEFSWQAPQANTSGLINVGQTFVGSAPSNQVPTADFIATCNGLSCSFDASNSADVDGTIASYSWDFGDLGVGVGLTTTHVYGFDGDYSVTLTVTDNQGATGSITKIVTAAEPPAAPIGLAAIGGSMVVELNWSANTEADLAGYNIYRSEVSGSGFVQENVSLLISATYSDSNVLDATTYFYKVSAVDSAGNESPLSTEIFATTNNPVITQNEAWINEIHYDNSGRDTGEFVEVAGTSGLDLSGWKLLAYNGNGGSVYKTITLNGVLTNQQNGFGSLSVNISGLQNGSADGIALVDNNNQVVQFLSYEGTLTASDGAALGMTSTDIGVVENSSTPVGYSLQLSGSGYSYADFVWQSAINETPNAVNVNQTFGQ